MAIGPERRRHSDADEPINLMDAINIGFGVGDPVLRTPTSTHLDGDYRLALLSLKTALTENPSRLSISAQFVGLTGSGLGKLTHLLHEDPSVIPLLRKGQMPTTDAEVENDYLFPLAVMVERDPTIKVSGLLMPYVAERGGDEVAGSPQRMRREYQVLVERFSRFKENREQS